MPRFVGVLTSDFESCTVVSLVASQSLELISPLASIWHWHSCIYSLGTTSIFNPVKLDK